MTSNDRQILNAKWHHFVKFLRKHRSYSWWLKMVQTSQGVKHPKIFMISIMQKYEGEPEQWLTKSIKDYLIKYGSLKYDKHIHERMHLLTERWWTYCIEYPKIEVPKFKASGHKNHNLTDCTKYKGLLWLNPTKLAANFAVCEEQAISIEKSWQDGWRIATKRELMGVIFHDGPLKLRDKFRREEAYWCTDEAGELTALVINGEFLCLPNDAFLIHMLQNEGGYINARLAAVKPIKQLKVC